MRVLHVSSASFFSIQQGLFEMNRQVCVCLIFTGTGPGLSQTALGPGAVGPLHVNMPSGCHYQSLSTHSECHFGVVLAAAARCMLCSQTRAVVPELCSSTLVKKLSDKVTGVSHLLCSQLRAAQAELQQAKQLIEDKAARHAKEVEERKTGDKKQREVLQAQILADRAARKDRFQPIVEGPNRTAQPVHISGGEIRRGVGNSNPSESAPAEEIQPPDSA